MFRVEKRHLAAVTLVSGLAFMASCSDGSTPNALDPATNTSQSLPAQTTASASDVSTVERMKLIEAQANTITPVTFEWLDQSQVASREASVIAGEKLSDVLEQIDFNPLSPEDELYIARITTPERGLDVGTDRQHPEIVPEFDDEVVWVIRMHHLSSPAPDGSIRDDVKTTDSDLMGYADWIWYIAPSGKGYGQEVPEA